MLMYLLVFYLLSQTHFTDIELFKNAEKNSRKNKCALQTVSTSWMRALENKEKFHFSLHLKCKRFSPKPEFFHSINRTAEKTEKTGRRNKFKIHSTKKLERKRSCVIFLEKIQNRVTRRRESQKRLKVCIQWWSLKWGKKGNIISSAAAAKKTSIYRRRRQLINAEKFLEIWKMCLEMAFASSYGFNRRWQKQNKCCQMT